MVCENVSGDLVKVSILSIVIVIRDLCLPVLQIHGLESRLYHFA